MSHWKLGRRHPACLRCERTFAEGEAHYSMLQIAADRLERLDLCPACWPAETAGSGAEGSSRAWWRARRPLNQKRGLAVDLEGIEALFHALADRRETRLLELRYVLSLLLLRKRRLRLVRATVRALGTGDEARGEFLVLRRPRRMEEEFLVQVFDFPAGRIEALRGDLERLFEGVGLEEVAPDSPTPDAVAEGSDNPETGAGESGNDAGRTWFADAERASKDEVPEQASDAEAVAEQPASSAACEPHVDANQARIEPDIAAQSANPSDGSKARSASARNARGAAARQRRAAQRAQGPAEDSSPADSAAAVLAAAAAVEERSSAPVAPDNHKPRQSRARSGQGKTTGDLSNG
jgi:hypothetical protein